MTKLQKLISLLTLTTLVLGLPAFGFESDQSSTEQTSDSIEQRVDQLLATMTLEQKVGQMIQAEIKYVTPDDVREYGLGSILNGGGSFPNKDKYAAFEDWVALADSYYDASVDSSQGSAGIPLIWGTDAVHGHNNVMGATIFPHNIGLGAANNPELIAQIGEATAIEVAATGIDWIFAPTIAVAKDDRWGRAYESYSDRPEIVVSYTAPIIEAMQENQIIATAKHFIGDGATYRGIDQGDARLDLETLVQEHGQGYVEAIDAGVMTVMASFNSWNGDKVHGEKTLLTDVLKEEMGFDGFVISDWNGIGQVDGCSNETCPQAINAGVDMLMVPLDWKELYANILNQVEEGVIPESRIDDAVRRILKVKFEIGLMDGVKPSEREHAGISELIGHSDHRAIARDAVRQSLVLLKNNQQLLPLDPSLNVVVAGTADDIGQQAGGWSISWQGRGNTNEDFPGATSILDGITAIVEQSGGSVIFRPNGGIGDESDATSLPDVAIVVFGEQPYAEGQGDLETLDFALGEESHMELLNSYRQLGIPVVALFVSGRPMWMNAELNASDAFVAAWLPGTEGGGVADVLFSDSDGNTRYDFTGRLSFDWPNANLSAENRDLPVSDHLFEYGYGLSVTDRVEIASDLSEKSLGGGTSLDSTVFLRGTKAPWQAYLGDSSHWDEPYSGGVVSSAYEELTVSAIDDQVQEDARTLEWSGDGTRSSQFYWQSQESQDFRELEELGAVLTMVVRVEEKPEGDVTLRMDCGWPCSGALNITSVLEELTIDQWTRISVDLGCLSEAGTNLAKVDSPLVLVADRPVTLSFREVAVSADVSPDSIIACGY